MKWIIGARISCHHPPAFVPLLTLLSSLFSVLPLLLLLLVTDAPLSSALQELLEFDVSADCYTLPGWTQDSPSTPSIGAACCHRRQRHTGGGWDGC